MRPVSGKSCNVGDLTFWEEPGRQLQFAVEVEEAVGMDGGVHQFTSRQGGTLGKSDFALGTGFPRVFSELFGSVLDLNLVLFFLKFGPKNRAGTGFLGFIFFQLCKEERIEGSNWCGRYATVHREVAGQRPPAVHADVSSKATKAGCSSVARFSVQKVGGRHVPGL